MEIPQETEDYIRESINDAVGLPMSSGTLLCKMRTIEASHSVLQNQYLCLQSKLKEKDEIIERSRAEASMNAVALKKFVEENHKLAMECAILLESVKKWERECSLYHEDREALMDFANEADERAKVAEARNCDLEEEKKKLAEELQFYKSKSEGQLIDGHTEDQEEQLLLDTLFTTLFDKDENTLAGHRFLESNNGMEVCQKLLEKWPSLRPMTQKIISLVPKMKNFQKDMDHLTINLLRAEEEVNALFAENKVLNEENKKLIRQCYKEKHMGTSGGGSSSGKGKRKSSHNTSSLVERKINLSDVDLQRQPLSPLENSPDSRMHKK